MLVFVVLLHLPPRPEMDPFKKKLSEVSLCQKSLHFFLESITVLNVVSFLSMELTVFLGELEAGIRY